MLGGTNTSIGGGKGGDEITVPITYKNNDLNIGDSVILTKKVEVEQPLCNPTNYGFKSGGPFCKDDDGNIYGLGVNGEYDSIKVFHINPINSERIDYVKSISTPIDYEYSLSGTQDTVYATFSKPLKMFALHNLPNYPSNNNLTCTLFCVNPVLTAGISGIEGFYLSRNSPFISYIKKEESGTYSIHCAKLSISSDGSSIIKEPIIIDSSTGITKNGSRVPIMSDDGTMLYFSKHLWKYNPELNKYELLIADCGLSISFQIGTWVTNNIILTNDGRDGVQFKKLDMNTYTFTTINTFNLNDIDSGMGAYAKSLTGLDDNNNMMIAPVELTYNHSVMFHLNDDETITRLTFDEKSKEPNMFSYVNFGNTYFMNDLIYEYVNGTMISKNIRSPLDPSGRAQDEIVQYVPNNIYYSTYGMYTMIDGKLIEKVSSGLNNSYYASRGKKNSLLSSSYVTLNGVSSKYTESVYGICSDWLYTNGLFSFQADTNRESFKNLWYQTDDVMTMKKLNCSLSSGWSNIPNDTFIVGKDGFCICLHYSDDKIYNVSINAEEGTYTPTLSNITFLGDNRFFSYGCSLANVTDDNKYVILKGRSASLQLFELTSTEMKPIEMPLVLGSLFGTNPKVKCFENHYIQVFSKNTLTLLKYENTIDDIRIVKQFRNIENGTFSFDLTKALIKPTKTASIQNFGGQIYNLNFVNEYELQKFDGFNFSSNSITGVIKDKTASEYVISTVLPTLVNGTITVDQDGAMINLLGSEA